MIAVDAEERHLQRGQLPLQVIVGGIQKVVNPRITKDNENIVCGGAVFLAELKDSVKVPVGVSRYVNHMQSPLNIIFLCR